MPNLTQAVRVAQRLPNLKVTPLTAAPSPLLSGRHTRPLWFDGRFLAAQDLKCEQNYFLQRQAELGQAGGFGVIHGLLVDQGATTTQAASAETIVIHAGTGLTPGGKLVMIPTDLTIQLSDLTDDQNLDSQFGLATAPQPPARTRTGVYVLALRPVEFTANPVSSYPSSIQAPRVAQDGDIVEATVVSLVPYSNPVNNYDTSLQQAALARQIFVTGSSAALSDSLLPLAMISIDRNAIQWIDQYLVRRDSGPQYSGTRLGLTDPATQQAFLMQYDAQLQTAVAARQASGSKANFAATDYFQALPPAGRLPLDAIDTVGLSQTFFPQQMDVQLSLIPADELPAVLADSQSLPPIDLTLPASSYANMSILVVIPVPRNNFAALNASLPQAQLNPALPQALTVRPSLPLLQLIQTKAILIPVSPVAATSWATAINGQIYGFYLRRRSQPIFADFTAAPALPISPVLQPITTPINLPITRLATVAAVAVNPIVSSAAPLSSAATPTPTTTPGPAAAPQLVTQPITTARLILQTPITGVTPT